MAAKQTPYTLFVFEDTDLINPREESDTFGKMMCWHNRHSLGDKHEHKNPNEFLIDLCDKTVPKDEIFQMIIDNRFENLWTGPDEENNEEYNIKSYSDVFDKWYTEATYKPPLEDSKDDIIDLALPFLEIPELLDILRDYNVILPLYLYDHSGLTMNTVGFSCPWDSGQVGWIYATHDDIRNEYGSLDVEKAENLLCAEVEVYDYYLKGQCYGFKLYEGEKEIDSCFGFYGDMADVSKHIKEHLPSECKHIVDTLEYEYDESENELFNLVFGEENEDEDEYETEI